MKSEKDPEKSDNKSNEEAKGHILQFIAAISGKIKINFIYIDISNSS